MPIALTSFACSALIIILAVNSWVAETLGRLFLSINKKVDEDYKLIILDSSIPFGDILKYLRLNLFLIMFAGLLLYIHLFVDDIYNFSALGSVIVWAISIRKVANFLVDFLINTKTMRALIEDTKMQSVELGIQKNFELPPRSVWELPPHRSVRE